MKRILRTTTALVGGVLAPLAAMFHRSRRWIQLTVGQLTAQMSGQTPAWQQFNDQAHVTAGHFRARPPVSRHGLKLGAPLHLHRA